MTATLQTPTLLAQREETYRRLLVEAMPFGRRRVAEIKASGEHVTDEAGRARQEAAALVSTAMITGQPLEQVIARLWKPSEQRKVA
jgi:hypothetical protein